MAPLMSSAAKLTSVLALAALWHTLRSNPFLRKSLYTFLYVCYERVTKARKARNRGFVFSKSHVTVEWLEKQLRKKHTQVKVGKVNVEVMGDDMGNASLMFRLRIDYVESAGLPDVMILKTPKNDMMSRIPFTATRMNEMEAAFFSHAEADVAPVPGIHVPTAFASKTNDVGNMFVLMEDITVKGAKFMTEEHPLETVAAAKEVCRGLARFHSPFWGSTRLEEGGDLHDSIIGQLDPVNSMVAQFMSVGWPRCIKRIGNRMPPNLVRNGIHLLQIAQRLHDYIGTRPSTVAHGDCHLENSYLMSANNEVGWELGLYDFQLMRRANGAMDLATFLGGSCAAEVLDSNEDELLQLYLDTLKQSRSNLTYTTVDGGSAVYALKELKHDFRIGLGLAFVWNVAAVLAIPFDSSAVSDYDTYFIRLCSTVDRLKIVNYCLAQLGGNQAQLSKRLQDSGITLRGKNPKWDVPPVFHVVDTTELPHKAHGYELFKAVHSTLKTGLYNRFLYFLKYRFMLRMTSSREGHHGQKLTGISDAKLEGHHPVDYAKGTPAEVAAFDSFYLSAFAPFDGPSPSLGLRWCKRVNDKEGETWLTVKTQDGVYTWVENPDTVAEVTYENENTVVVKSLDGTCILKLCCITPMEEWKVEFVGKLRKAKDGSLVNSKFDLSWVKSTKMFSFGTDVSPELTARALALETFSKPFFDELRAAHQEHYEQFGMTTGTMQIGDRTYKVNAKGMRDRAFGMRDWGYMQRYISSYFYTGPMSGGNSFNFTFASLPTLSNARFGFVNLGDNVHANLPMNAMSADISQISTEGIPCRELCFSFVAGEAKITYTVLMTVDDGDTVLFNMGPGRMLVNYRFAKYKVSWIDPVTGAQIEEIGYGASEFAYRFDGVEPKIPSLKDLKELPIKAGIK